VTVSIAEAAPAAASLRSGRVRKAIAEVRRRPELLTLALCAVILLVGIRGPDLPAQNYRVWLLRHHGFVVFDSHWYAGHTLPGYSLLFPPIAAVTGARLVGALCCVAATAALARLLRRDSSPASQLALVWFAVVVVLDLMVGRLPFALGLAAGIGALVAARENRMVWTGLLALVCSAASPLAGAFLLFAAVAWLPDAGWRRIWPLAMSAVGIAAAAVFGEGGRFPFSLRDLLAIAATVAVGLLAAPRSSRLLRRGLVLYLAATLVLYLVPNPIGGNWERLAAIMAGPLAALELYRAGRRWVLAAITVPLLLWQFAPVLSAIGSSYSPSAHAGYYSGLVHYLQAHGGTSERVEVPLTQARWETDYLATKFALARGWERQVDIEHNSVLYDDHLSASAYEEWLETNAVRFVALPDVALDSSEKGERALLTKGALPFLRLVWTDRHWKLWAVPDVNGLVAGPARLVTLGVSQFTIDAQSAGAVTVYLRWTRFWQVTAGEACIAPTADGWTSVVARGPGIVTVSARVGIGNIAGGGSSGSCS
jgi:hypothetical protein